MAELPEYRRIREALRSRIASGEFAPGDRFPSQQELVDQFGVAHMTIRHAIDGLVQDGLLLRRRGAGTYVLRTRSLRRSANRLSGFTADIGSGTAGAVVVSQEEIEPSDEVRDHLELAKGRVTRLVRVRTVDGEPTALHEVLVPLSVAPTLIREDMTNRSLYEFFGSIGIQPETAVQRIYASSADANQASLLKVKPNSPLLVSERVSKTANNTPIEFAVMWSRPDTSVLIELRR